MRVFAAPVFERLGNTEAGNRGVHGASVGQMEYSVRGLCMSKCPSSLDRSVMNLSWERTGIDGLCAWITAQTLGLAHEQHLSALYMPGEGRVLLEASLMSRSGTSRR